MGNKAFTVDFTKNFHMLIPPMLAAGIDVLIYAGDQDFICNWLGNEKWTLALPWEHKAEFNAAGKKPFVLTGKEAGAKAGKEVGELRSVANFHFLRVYQAGHMVPMDQPEAALGMLNALLDGTFLKTPTAQLVVWVLGRRWLVVPVAFVVLSSCRLTSRSSLFWCWSISSLSVRPLCQRSSASTRRF